MSQIVDVICHWEFRELGLPFGDSEPNRKGVSETSFQTPTMGSVAFELESLLLHDTINMAKNADKNKTTFFMVNKFNVNGFKGI